MKNDEVEEQALYTKAQALFLESIELPLADRQEFLDRVTSTDSRLRAEVLALLRFHAEDERETRDAGPDLRTPIPSRIGRYRVLRAIGHGSVGVVYLAVDDSADALSQSRSCAQRETSPGLRERFRQEGEILRRLDHPGIARLFDAGLFESASGHIPYYAMEFVDGTSLRSFARPERASERGRVQLLAAICDAVHHAHQQGVIHRDLKPENILVDRAGQPKILDFGIARLIDIDPRASLQMTTAGAILGTLQYMSPEQATGAGAPIDARSDIYSLGSSDTSFWPASRRIASPEIRSNERSRAS